MSKVKFRPHKGLAKRVRITRNGQVKHRKAGGRHRKSLHDSGQNRQLRLGKMAPNSERRRAQKMLGFRIRRPAAKQQQQAEQTAE
ncbi:MAG: 50S ribosomal protein L35 [Planctomycetes bacterium]|nr:50S ribosomal protein L35 [Planctomycetota bacterium]NOG54859.1 hypothetical protein [Planctomycetota bacterium]